MENPVYLVGVLYAKFDAGARDDGWESLYCAQLSENGGNDALVPPGQLKRGLYLVEYDFSGVDAAARQIYKKDGADYVPLNPSGFFLAARSCVTLKARAADRPRSARAPLVRANIGWRCAGGGCGLVQPPRDQRRRQGDHDQARRARALNGRQSVAHPAARRPRACCLLIGVR